MCTRGKRGQISLCVLPLPWWRSGDFSVVKWLKTPQHFPICVWWKRNKPNIDRHMIDLGATKYKHKCNINRVCLWNPQPEVKCKHLFFTLNKDIVQYSLQSTNQDECIILTECDWSIMLAFIQKFKSITIFLSNICSIWLNKLYLQMLTISSHSI